MPTARMVCAIAGLMLLTVLLAFIPDVYLGPQCAERLFSERQAEAAREAAAHQALQRCMDTVEARQGPHPVSCLPARTVVVWERKTRHSSDPYRRCLEGNMASD